jgi:hypothetical protein
MILRDSVTTFLASGFFHKSPFPKPLKITLGSFWIFSKTRRDIRKSRCTTGINNTCGKFGHWYNWCCWYPRQICHQYQRQQRQIMKTISGCRHLKVILKAKVYIYVNSTTQRCPNKPRISPRIFKKIWNSRNCILSCLGETDSWKKQKLKISCMALSLSVRATNHSEPITVSWSIIFILGLCPIVTKNELRCKRIREVKIMSSKLVSADW